jgi:glycosyltransferase involved in cell wall biosynthesis
MRFSVDAHAIGRHLTGNEVYIRNLLQGFAALDRDSEFLAYYSVPGAHRWIPEGFTTHRVSTNPFVRLGLELSLRVQQDRPDMLHVQYTAPLVCPVPVVVSVHDVSFLEHPEFFTKPRVLQLKHTVAHTVRKAAWILTPSEFSRKSIERAYGPMPNVTVVPNAVSSVFRPLPRETSAAWVQSKFNIGGPYVLTVGDLQPRKNHIGLIEAFCNLMRSCPQFKHKLVFVGKDTWYGERVRRAAELSGFGDRIHFTGFVSDEELIQLYGACEMFVFPSFYEGFGLPILEAMACGRAVACSNTSAMPEVANAAGILFDPTSVSEMACAMHDLLIDPQLRMRMERLGLNRTTQFTWEKTAKKTLDVYYRVAGAKQKSIRSRIKTSV